MNKQEKRQLKEIATQLRVSSQVINDIIRTGEKYDLILTSQIVEDYAGRILTIART